MAVGRGHRRRPTPAVCSVLKGDCHRAWPSTAWSKPPKRCRAVARLTLYRNQRPPSCNPRLIGQLLACEGQDARREVSNEHPHEQPDLLSLAGGSVSTHPANDGRARVVRSSPIDSANAREDQWSSLLCVEAVVRSPCPPQPARSVPRPGGSLPLTRPPLPLVRRPADPQFSIQGSASGQVN